MTSTWSWPGAHWWRVDFHTHTPESHDFDLSGVPTTADWDAWVIQARAVGLHAVVVTDHNSPNGIDHVQAAVKRLASDLTVFPGVEVTVEGIHLLFIFEQGSSPAFVVAFLAKLGINPDAFGRPDTVSKKGLDDTIDCAVQTGALVIAAHINKDKGCVYALKDVRRPQLLTNANVAALEIAAFSPSDPSLWIDPTSQEVQGWLDGSRTQGKKPTQVTSSDAHATTELGRGSTWIKMTKPTLEGLRLALLDGADSVKSADKNDPSRPPTAPPSLAIERILVEKAVYMGRNPPFELELNPWLNCIIGGRGTGKSSIVDFLRKVMRRDGELKAGTDLRIAFDDRLKVHKQRTDGGLLTVDAVLQVDYRRDDQQFRLEWTPAGTGPSIRRRSGDAWVEDAGDIPERFPVRIYSQKQLFELAQEPTALLTIIDDAKDVDGIASSRRVKELESRYLAELNSARALRTSASNLPTIRASLNDVKDKLELLGRGGNAKALASYRAYHRATESWDAAHESALDQTRSVQSAIEGLSTIDIVFNDPQIEVEHRSALDRAANVLRERVTNLRTSLLNELTQAARDLEALPSSDDIGAWKRAIASVDQEYSRVAAELAKAGISKPDEYRDLVQRGSLLEREIAALETKEQQANSHQQAALELLREVREEKAAHFERRRRFAETHSDTHCRVEIKRFGSYAELMVSDRNDEVRADALRAALPISGFAADLALLWQSLAGPDGKSFQLTKLDDLIALLRGIADGMIVANEAIGARMHTRIKGLKPEELDRLALYSPEDSVEVSFLDNRSGRSAWKPIETGSPGQQTAALLAFLLGHGTEPVILDQPEDDLDNALIYELLVQRIREIKTKRQVIIVTHNPNIVVHGDAEFVACFEPRSGQTIAEVSGGLQEQCIRDKICEVMEGGRDAFERRYTRIAGRRGDRSLTRGSESL